MKRLRVMIAALIICVAAAISCEASIAGKSFYRGLSQRLYRNRTDYPSLSDEEFANFREVRTSGIGKGKLYRSSSPISTWGNRNAIADRAARDAGVRTFINLADNASAVREHKGFESSYYSTQKVIALGLGMKYQSKQFRDSLAEGITKMARSEPPYLVHCSLGKDRAGFICALIECLMGADINEVTRDYLISFYNYFGIEPGSDEYNFVVNNEIRAFLAQAFGVKSEELVRINLADGAERYFRGIGVSTEDIELLREKLRP